MGGIKMKKIIGKITMKKIIAIMLMVSLTLSALPSTVFAASTLSKVGLTWDYANRTSARTKTVSRTITRDELIILKNCLKYKSDVSMQAIALNTTIIALATGLAKVPVKFSGTVAVGGYILGLISDTSSLDRVIKYMETTHKSFKAKLVYTKIQKGADCYYSIKDVYLLSSTN